MVHAKVVDSWVARALSALRTGAGWLLLLSAVLLGVFGLFIATSSEEEPALYAAIVLGVAGISLLDDNLNWGWVIARIAGSIVALVILAMAATALEGNEALVVAAFIVGGLVWALISLERDMKRVTANHAERIQDLTERIRQLERH